MDVRFYSKKFNNNSRLSISSDWRGRNICYHQSERRHGQLPWQSRKIQWSRHAAKSWKRSKIFELPEGLHPFEIFGLIEWMWGLLFQNILKQAASNPWKNLINRPTNLIDSYRVSVASPAPKKLGVQNFFLFSLLVSSKSYNIHTMRHPL